VTSVTRLSTRTTSRTVTGSLPLAYAFSGSGSGCYRTCSHTGPRLAPGLQVGALLRCNLTSQTKSSVLQVESLLVELATGTGVRNLNLPVTRTMVRGPVSQQCSVAARPHWRHWHWPGPGHTGTGTGRAAVHWHCQCHCTGTASGNVWHHLTGTVRHFKLNLLPVSHPSRWHCHWQWQRNLSRGHSTPY
jgi:hypothetical protein